MEDEEEEEQRRRDEEEQRKKEKRKAELQDRLYKLREHSTARSEPQQSATGLATALPAVSVSWEAEMTLKGTSYSFTIVCIEQSSGTYPVK